MKYTIVCKNQDVFTTNWFKTENNWNDNILCVIDNWMNRVTFNGTTWKDIEKDHL